MVDHRLTLLLYKAIFTQIDFRLGSHTRFFVKLVDLLIGSYGECGFGSLPCTSAVGFPSSTARGESEMPPSKRIEWGFYGWLDLEGVLMIP